MVAITFHPLLTKKSCGGFSTSARLYVRVLFSGVIFEHEIFQWSKERRTEISRALLSGHLT
jgi:hypothetical protein